MRSPAAIAPPSVGAPAPSQDQRVFLHDVSWEEYEGLLEVRGEASVPRMTFLEGELELMTPSRDHEAIKTRLGRLVEAWAEHSGVELYGLGSWTVKQRGEQRGAEADECYLVDPSLGEGAEAWPQRPDLVVEVVWSPGGIDKLEVWRRLGVPEVWIWRSERLDIYALRGDRYEEIASSAVLAGLDLELLIRFVRDPPGQTAAVRAYRAALGGGAAKAE